MFQVRAVGFWTRSMAYLGRSLVEPGKRLGGRGDCLDPLGGAAKPWQERHMDRAGVGVGVHT